MTNTGTANLSITSVAVAGGNSGDFVGAATNCAVGPIAPGRRCHITLSFAPNAVGNRASAIVVQSNVAGGSTQIVPVSGLGVAAGAPSVGLSPTSIDFGDQLSGTQSGTQAVTITQHQERHADAHRAAEPLRRQRRQFRHRLRRHQAGSGNLAPGACTVTAVRFSPGSTGQRSTALRFDTNASGSPHLVNLTGNGVAAPTTRAVRLPQARPR
ncbi:MAG: choice-of-anchor D domain-containing protein [Thermomicrobiales bacterium]